MTFREHMEQFGVRVIQDNYVEWRGCTRKRRYSTYEAARAASRRTDHGWPYGPCEHCTGFHVGHTTVGDSQQ